MADSGFEDYSNMVNSLYAGCPVVIKMFLKSAADKFLVDASREGNIDRVRRMLKEGATNYNAAMSHAAYNGYIDIVKLLQNLATSHNEAICQAAQRGHIDIVTLISDNRERVNCNWAMAYAASNGHIDIVKLMLERGADNYNGAAKWALDADHLDIVRLLLDKGADCNMVLIAGAKKGSIDIVKIALEKGAYNYNEVINAISNTDIKKLLEPYTEKTKIS